MSNTNCLEGIRCPKCGQEDRFFIIGGAQFEVTDDGSETVGDHEWDDDSAMSCPECSHAGKVKDFHIRPDLPPDPDGMNGARAAWAGSALATFMLETGAEEDAALGDLLCDLMHWCDRNRFDFEAALDRARSHYNDETTAEEVV